MGKIRDILGEKKTKNEAADVGQMIKNLIAAKASGSNDDQGKIVQLLKGLAFSDDPKSDAFMKKLTGMMNKSNFGDLVEDDEMDDGDSEDDNKDKDGNDIEDDDDALFDDDENKSKKKK